MDKWKDTRKRLIAVDPNLSKLPTRWETRLDLREAYLRGVALSKAYLTGVDLYKAYLREADLHWADLSGTLLSGADLTMANLNEASLRGVDLSGANLPGANLRWVDMSMADLSGADLRWVDLCGADLRGTDLRRANLTGANLYGVDLRKAKLDFSHDLASEILRQAAKHDTEKLKVAAIVLLQRHWCWDNFLALDDPLQDWALDELAKYHVEDDNAPEFIVERAKGK